MKYFLAKLCLFALPIFVMLFVLDSGITAALTKSRKADFAIWNELTEGKINADIVIYGSSRAWVHFNPQILEDSLSQTVYNLGIDGYKFAMQYYRHNVLLIYNTKPAFIIHALDFNTLEKQYDLYNAKQFLPYIKNDLIRDATSRYNGLGFYDYHLPFVRYHGQSQAIYNAIGIKVRPDKNTPDRYKGYQGQERVWTDDLSNQKAKQDHYEVEVDPEILKWFKEYLKELRKNRIKVILVYPPEYIEGQNYVSNRKQVMNLYKKIAADNKLLLLDFSDSSICKNRSMFYNSMHLNKEGSELFSKQVAHLLKLNLVPHE